MRRLKGLKSVIVCAALLTTHAPLASANEGEFEISVSSGSANIVLKSLAVQTQSPLLFPFDHLDDVEISGVEGTYTIQQALDIILSGSEFEGRVTENGAIVIFKTQINEPDTKEGNVDFSKTAKKLKSGVSATVLTAAMASVAQAQTVDNQANTVEDEIIVVGTQIKGSSITGILPVTTLDVTDIEVTGAVSGDELFQSIPQLGGVSFNDSRFSGVNGARGDVGSVNLRDVGTGNTLVLLNGRRLVLHPGTQAEDLVPVVSVNTNALPVTGIKRLEVLRDGASAVYGTDAVAGVVNTILDDNYEGLELNLQYGTSEGTSLDELTGSFKWGKDFNDGKTNISIFGNAMLRNGMPATDLVNSASEDLRPLFEGTIYEGDSQLRNLSTDSQEARYISLVDGDRFGSTVRLDRAPYRDIVGDTDRYNIFAFLNHDLDNGATVFGEASYYFADYNKGREMDAILSGRPIAVAADAAFNPIGEDLSLTDYRPLDAGRRFISVKNNSFRGLLGLRGQLSDWDWETAALYSRAETNDKARRISRSLFQDAVNRTDGNAYNPFAGGNADSTTNFANDQSVIDPFLVDVRRDGTTELALADIKFSNPAILSWTGGDIGIAVGAEVRHEAYEDDRDDRLDGTIVHTDSVTGTVYGSDVLGTSPSADTNGSRDVLGAYIELAVPFVNPDMDIPLVHSFDMQLAARAEDYSDVGSVLKPKVAASWHLFEPFQIRAAYSEGFRAPNLEQVNADGVTRVNSGREDWILCEATARANNTAFSTGDCDSVSVESLRQGGPDLEPETNTNISLGAVFEPVQDLIFTLDWWRIKQDNIVGLFSDQNQISLDYLLRSQGSSNPNVIRATPDATRTALFNAAGLTPAGEIVQVLDPYTNLDQREIEGIDIGAQYRFDTDDFGDFRFKVNAAHLKTFFQEPGGQGLALIDAVNSGVINDAVSVAGAEDRIKQNGRPEWRWTASVTWDRGNWGAGAFYKYVGDVEDTSVNGDGYDFLAVDSFKTLNLYADYTFDEASAIGDTRLRFGVRNVGDKKPPLADEFARGYFTELYSNRGRYWYGSIRKRF